MKKAYAVGVLNKGSKEQGFAFENKDSFVIIVQGKMDLAIPNNVIYSIFELLEKDGEIDMTFECKFPNKTIYYEVFSDLDMLSIILLKDTITMSKDQFHLFIHLFLDLEVPKC